MSFWKNSVSNDVILPRGGYGRGFLAATACASIGFIIFNTAFPVEPFPVLANSALTASNGMTPTMSSSTDSATSSTGFATTSKLAGPATPSLGAGPTPEDASAAVSEIGLGNATTSNIAAPRIRTPNLGTTSSGAPIAANLTSQGGAPTLLGGGRPTLLGESQTNGQTNLASIDVSTTRPTGGFGTTERRIIAPNSDGTIQTQTASLSVDPSFPAIVPVSDGAFASHSQLFTDSKSRALVSIVLHVDTIEQAVASAGLAASVTLSVDANNPDAARIISAYNDFGGESLLSIPTTGNLQLRADDEFATVRDKLKLMLPDELRVIGVMDTSGAVPDNPQMVDAVLRVLAPWGHAIVTPNLEQPHGAQGLANEVGLPATSFVSALTSFTDRGAMVQEMDRVVSGADVSDSVVVFGNADSETLAALNTWLTGAQAGKVTMAPVSAAIMRN